MFTNSARWRAILSLCLAAATITACQAGASPASPSPDLPTSTKPPAPTATRVPTSTPLPTRTPSPTVDLQATQSAQATAAMEALMTDIDDSLQQAGYSANEGYVAWADYDPLEVNSTNYGFFLSHKIAEEQDFGDFVYHTRVTWDTSTGLAGCGVIFRSEEDMKRGEQFIFFTMRLSGAPFWDVELWQYERPKSVLTGTMKPNGAINVEKESTNELLLVAEGHQLTVYANGTRLGAVTILRRSEGRMAVLAWQESGYATCTYQDSWIWVPGNPDGSAPPGSST